MAELELKDDILPTVRDIAAYVYGQATPSTERRIRHLCAAHNFPHKKAGARIESRRSWVDEYYSTPTKRESAA